MAPDEKEVNNTPPTPEKPAEPKASTADIKAQQPQFENLRDEAEAKGADDRGRKIDFLYDVRLNVDVELGRAELKVKDILALRPGSVVELNRLAGDPVEVIVNGKLIARGEVIVIDENFAVRVTDILSPSEIVSSLEHY